MIKSVEHNNYFTIIPLNVVCRTLILPQRTTNTNKTNKKRLPGESRVQLQRAYNKMNNTTVYIFSEYNVKIFMCSNCTIISCDYLNRFVLMHLLFNVRKLLVALEILHGHSSVSLLLHRKFDPKSRWPCKITSN